MTTRTIRAEDFDRVIAERLAADVEQLRLAAYDTCQRGVARAVKATDEGDVRDQGMYRLSWKAERTREGAELRNDSPHAGVIELGRRPNRPGPPLEPILEWVMRQGRRGKLKPLVAQFKAEYRVSRALTGVIANRKVRARARRQLGPMTEAVNFRAYLFAKAVRDAIHFRGSKPKLVLRGITPQLGEDFVEAVRRQLRRRR